ncbi:hypothetical protein [Pseudomonas shirazensis]|uniref:hypothetical protein n=1 Tax=Pseudomonas shirazensis TaxID=2745494 RepID=UPI00398892EE
MGCLQCGAFDVDGGQHGSAALLLLLLIVLRSQRLTVQYIIRRSVATESMLAKIIGHQAHIAQAYVLSQDSARWLLATVAFHCFAVADTVYSATSLEPLPGVDQEAEKLEMEAALVHGVRALINGAVGMLAQAGDGV